MTPIRDLFAAVFRTHGIVGVLLVALQLAIGIGSVLWLSLAIAGAVGRSIRRAWRRHQLRKELRILRGGRPEPIFTSYGEFATRPQRPPVRSLRKRGDDDVA